MSTAVVPLDLTDHLDGLRALYLAVFAEPPWHEDAAAADAFIGRLAAERASGARGVGLEADGRLVGMAYAVPTPTPFPSGRAYDKVARLCDPHDLEGAWELMELAVHPDARGAGSATHLLTALLADCSPMWLLTASDATAALRFYDRRDDLRRIGEGDGVVVYATL